jgi:hypothetical protein
MDASVNALVARVEAGSLKERSSAPSGETLFARYFGNWK